MYKKLKFQINKLYTFLISIKNFQLTPSNFVHEN